MLFLKQVSMNDASGHSKQEIEAEFPVKALELLLFDSSR